MRLLTFSGAVEYDTLVGEMGLMNIGIDRLNFEPGSSWKTLESWKLTNIFPLASLVKYFVCPDWSQKMHRIKLTQNGASDEHAEGNAQESREALEEEK